MNVSDLVAVRVSNPRSRFKAVEKPMYVYTDFPWQGGPVAIEDEFSSLTGFSSSPELQAIFPQPLRVPCNSELAAGADTDYDDEFDLMDSLGGWDATLSMIDWHIITEVGTIAYRPVWGLQTQRSLGLAATALQGDASANSIEFSADLDCHAFTATVQWSPQPKKRLASGSLGGTSSASTSSRAWIGVTVGAGDDAMSYRVLSEAAGTIKLEKRPSGGSWTAAEAQGHPVTTSPNSESYSQGQAEPDLVVEFRLLGGRLDIRIGNRADPIVLGEARIDASGNALTTITGALIGGQIFTALTFWAEPIKWTAIGRYSSTEIPIGFSSTSFQGVECDLLTGTGDGWSVSIDDSHSSITGPNIYFAVDIVGPVDGTYKGVAYSDNPIAIRAINLIWAKVEVQDVRPSWSPIPLSAVVEHQFDLGALTIRSSSQLTFPNNYPRSFPDGFGTWGAWSVNRGQVALEIELARTTATGSVASQIVFTGYGHRTGRTVGESGGSTFTLESSDRLCQLDSQRWDLPWMDGWNVFYAMAYLGQLGGWAVEDMGFAALVPPSPTGENSDLGDGRGGPAYYLPIGPVGSVLTRQAAPNLLEAMYRIASSIGYMLFADVNGILQFTKFALPAGTKRRFFESDRQSLGGLEGAWSIEVVKDMSQVRSESIVVGIGEFSPTWNAIVARYSDDAVAQDPSAFNHLGYRSPSAWVDSQFAQEDYADESAQLLHRIGRNPGLTVSITTWSQPDIFPLDTIELVSDRFGTTGIRLMVVGVRHTSTTGAPTSQIRAMFIPE